ncbi:MAG TPA: discoidin domain-containing protein, partial [Vicinamibacterales bacterium]|nr:discoidin domain-containing protein [Vicinamibacterales bacterium]
SAPMPTLLPGAGALAGRRTLLLPITPESDMVFTYDAVVAGGAAVNGYSGYEPTYYPALMAAIRMEDPALFEPFQRYGALDVVVMNTAPRLRAAVEHVPGAAIIERDDAVTEYRLPPKPAAYATAPGHVVPIAHLSTDCAPEIEDRALDRSLDSIWMCPQTRDATFTIDVGQPSRLAAVVTEMGQYVADYPNALTVETSIDGERWDPAWTGSGLAPLVWSAIDQPTRVPLTMAFTPRTARFIRLRQTGRDSLHAWAIPEVQVRAQ